MRFDLRPAQQRCKTRSHKELTNTAVPTSSPRFVFDPASRTLCACSSSGLSQRAGPAAVPSGAGRAAIHFGMCTLTIAGFFRSRQRDGVHASTAGLAWAAPAASLSLLGASSGRYGRRGLLVA
jgi:hypothetical protein